MKAGREFDLPCDIYLLQFVSGLLPANGVLHFVNGVSGHWFQTSFAARANRGPLFGVRVMKGELFTLFET
jgi:hypothetical protein